MQLYESKFKDFINMAKVMKLVGEGENVNGDDAMGIAKNFYNTLMGVENNEAKVISYIKNITNNADLVSKYTIDDHIEAFRVSESNLEEGVVSSAVLSVLASVIMSGGLSKLDDNGFNPDDFDHGDDIEMVDSNVDDYDHIGDVDFEGFEDDDVTVRKSGVDPHGINEALISEGDEMDMSGSITFDQAKELGLLPIDGPNTSSKLRERNLRYFTITKPNDDGFSKVIYWIEKEDAKEAGRDFRVDSSIDVSLYS